MADIKRFTLRDLYTLTTMQDTEYVLHSDHEAALKAAVAARDDKWATAIAKYAPFDICKMIADEMERDAAHE